MDGGPDTSSADGALSYFGPSKRPPAALQVKPDEHVQKIRLLSGTVRAVVWTASPPLDPLPRAWERGGTSKAYVRQVAPCIPLACKEMGIEGVKQVVHSNRSV